MHVHPRLRPDNRQVLFTTDSSGYGNVHLVDVPDLDSLPLASARPTCPGRTPAPCCAPRLDVTRGL
ncbi:hypothetical protein ABN034_13210 [Actinopolymorpha sp. B11F2]|uniref:hypothetical protein n=1 Tax=Actinopolymorpha sp. B11F2 TaxID=3160862 RepID=UPI0032E51082